MSLARFALVPTLVVVVTFVVTHAVGALVVWRSRPAGSDPLRRWRTTHPDAADALGPVAVIAGMALFIAYHVAAEPVWVIMWFPFAVGVAALTAVWLFDRLVMRLVAAMMIVASLWPHRPIFLSRPSWPTTSGLFNDVQIVAWTAMVTVWVGWVIARRCAQRTPSLLPAVAVMAAMAVLDVIEVVGGLPVLSPVFGVHWLGEHAAGDGVQNPTHISAPFTYAADGSPAMLGDAGAQTLWLPDMTLADLLLAGIVLMVVVVAARRLGRPSLVVGALVGTAVGVVMSEWAGEVVFRAAQPALPYLCGPMVLGVWLAASRCGVARQVFGRRRPRGEDRDFADVAVGGGAP